MHTGEDAAQRSFLIKAAGIAWFACATTLAEARAAEAAGADAIVAQGSEAGGHRGAFDATAAERQSVGLFALVPRLADRELEARVAAQLADIERIGKLRPVPCTAGSRFDRRAGRRINPRKPSPRYRRRVLRRARLHRFRRARRAGRG